jgi:hypothetical protein
MQLKWVYGQPSAPAIEKEGTAAVGMPAGATSDPEAHPHGPLQRAKVRRSEESL